jgi:hypothetical protein
MKPPSVRRAGLVPASATAGLLTLGLVMYVPSGTAAAGTLAAVSTTTPGTTSVIDVALAGVTGSLPAGASGTPTASFTENTVAEAQLAALDDFSEGAASASAKTLNGVPVVGSTPVTSPVGLGASFKGIDAYQNSVANQSTNFGPEPPDQALCVGNGFVLEGVNDALRVFHANGSPASGVVGLSDFYGYPPPTNPTTGARGPEVTDPTCIYDAGTNRFYFLALTLAVDPKTGALTGPNHLDLAVSRTGSPLGGWQFYRIPVQDDGSQGTQTHPDCPCIGDYPHIGADAYGVYVTTNEFPLAGSGRYGGYNGAQVYALDKSRLANGASHVRGVHIDDPIAGSGSNALPGFTVWPANVPGGAYDTSRGGTEYFVSSVAVWSAAGTGDLLQLWRLTGSQTLATTHPNVGFTGQFVASQRYTVPPASEQKVGPTPLADCLQVVCQPGQGPSNASEGPLDSNDSRVQQVTLAGGQVYTALDTGAVVGGNLQAGIAWFAIQPAAALASSTVAGQGYLAVSGQNVTYPALSVRSDGKGAMAFTLAGRSWFPTAAYALFGSGGTSDVHVAGRGVAPEDGHCEYAFYNCAGNPTTPQARPRWGDYGAAQVVGGKVWIASEYISDRCTFAEFSSDPTCGHDRVIRANWSTHIAVVTP